MDYEEISLKSLFCSSCGHFKPSGVRYIIFAMAVNIYIYTYINKYIYLIYIYIYSYIYSYIYIYIYHGIIGVHRPLLNFRSPLNLGPPLIYLVGLLSIQEPHINICVGPLNICVALKQFNLLPPNTFIVLKQFH